MQQIIFIVFFFFLFHPGQAQQYKLNLEAPDNKPIHQWRRDQPDTQDSLSWILARNQLLQALHSEGFLMAEIPWWVYAKDTLHVKVEPGNKIHWAKLSFRAEEFLPPHWVKDLDLTGAVVDYQYWRNNVIEVLRSAQEQGYLFADYTLRIIELKDDSLFAEIAFNPGVKIVFDTIEIQGTARLSREFLQKSLGLKRGDPVTPEDLIQLQEQLNNLRFVQQVSPPVLILFDDKATVRVYLNNRNASSFDILAGFQPSSDPEKAFTLTGYVDLDLVNQLSKGERIYLHLEKLRPRSQELELSLSYPYLLDLPFGVEGEFNLMKNDTFYSDLRWKAGIVLPIGYNQFVRAGVTQQATNIISIDKNRILSTKRLPPYVDLRVNGLTLGIARNRLDYDLNPRAGYTFSLDGTFSQKKIRSNNLIEDLNDIDPDFDYAALYDTLREPVSRIAVESALQYFIPWGSRSTIRLAINAGALKSGGRIFTNELYRLGGYLLLRGFDEESILAQYYSVFSAEYRLIIGGGSYVSLFSDYAWVQNDDVEIPLVDHPFGVGIGITLETNAGIFGMRAAVGSQQGNPLDFNNTRIHLGYINRF